MTDELQQHVLSMYRNVTCKLEMFISLFCVSDIGHKSSQGERVGSNL